MSIIGSTGIKRPINKKGPVKILAEFEKTAAALIIVEKEGLH